MDKALIIIFALLLNIVFGGPRRLYDVLGFSDYAAMPGSFMRGIERKLNREHRPPEERLRRGIILLAVVSVVSMLLGLAINALLGNKTVDVLVLAFCFPLRSAWERISTIRTALLNDDPASAHAQLEGTVFRHHALLDAHGVARAGIEFTAVQFSERIIAPIFWYVLFGLPGLFLAKAIYLLRETTANAGAKPGAFGAPAALAHEVMNYIPSRLAALQWMLASIFLADINWRVGARKLRAGLLREPPAALALLSSASMLSLTLGGPSSAYINDRWVGTGVTRATANDVRRAQLLFGFLCALLFCELGLFL